ncbi:hypothetical protein EDB19DRAFT_1958156 [Suillus lakei]|nr:hypothetical protein EDB19DRAFT_1958156 [Suillus lakei]
MYLQSHHGCGGYAEGLGLKVLQLIRQPNGIATYRQEFGEILDGLKSPSQSLLHIEGGDDFDTPSREWSQSCRCTYEIDLDRNIFYIDGMPFFSLECLPDDDAFLQYISEDQTSEDHYGHAVWSPRCTPVHKYKKPTPPIVDDSDLATYQSLMCTGSQVALSDLLAISDILSQDEHIRVSLLEVMIGQCMVSPVVGKEIYEIELSLDHNQLTDDQWSIACFMAGIAFVPQIFDNIWQVCHPEPKRKEFTWKKDNPGHYFGIAFAVYHCAIVKVVKDAHTITFSHTNALQFIPSFYAHSPSTPGITALARLGYRIDPALFGRAMMACRYKLPTSIQTKESLAQDTDGSDDVPPKITGPTVPLELWREMALHIQAYNLITLGLFPNLTCPTLPLELWREIALYLQPFDLISLGLVSKLCHGAALVVLRCPHLCGYRLLAVPKNIPKYLQTKHVSLRAACFSAVRAGIPTTVHVGVKLHDTPSERMTIPLRLFRIEIKVVVSFSTTRDPDVADSGAHIDYS